MKFAINKSIAAYLLAGAILLQTTASGKNQVIEINHTPFELDLTGIAMPLHIQQNGLEGDVTVSTHPSDELTIAIEDIDDEGYGKKAFLVINSANGTISLSLNGQYLDRDVEWVVPRSTSLSIQTVEGDVTINGVEGDIDCMSVDGSIELTDVSGRVSVATQDGDIAVQLDRLIPEHPISITTEDGDIALMLPTDPDVGINASTIDGNIFCEFPIRTISRPNPKNRDRSIWTSIVSENTLIGGIGEGTLPIQLHTLDGDIAIVRSKQE